MAETTDKSFVDKLPDSVTKIVIESMEVRFMCCGIKINLSSGNVNIGLQEEVMWIVIPKSEKYKYHEIVAILKEEARTILSVNFYGIPTELIRVYNIMVVDEKKNKWVHIEEYLDVRWNELYK
jgi:hypothetical protein